MQRWALAIFFFFFGCLGFHCCAWAFSSCGERGLLFVVVRGLLIAVASFAAEHGFSSCCMWAQYLWLTGSRAQAQ